MGTGRLLGNCGINNAKAWGPPVEIPMAIKSIVAGLNIGLAGTATGRNDPKAGRGRRFKGTLAAALTLSINSSANSFFQWLKP